MASGYAPVSSSSTTAAPSPGQLVRSAASGTRPRPEDPYPKSGPSRNDSSGPTTTEAPATAVSTGVESRVKGSAARKYTAKKARMTRIPGHNEARYSPSTARTAQRISSGRHRDAQPSGRRAGSVPRCARTREKPARRVKSAGARPSAATSRYPAPSGCGLGPTCTANMPRTAMPRTASTPASRPEPPPRPPASAPFPAPDPAPVPAPAPTAVPATAVPLRPEVGRTGGVHAASPLPHRTNEDITR